VTIAWDGKDQLGRKAAAGNGRSLKGVNLEAVGRTRKCVEVSRDPG
jgi:hypothetical protein